MIRQHLGPWSFLVSLLALQLKLFVMFRTRRGFNAGPAHHRHVDTDTHCIYHSTMTKKLVQHGNSAALILDKPILELLNVTMDTPLEISTDGKSIVISPVTSHTEAEFLASLERVNARFSTTLSKLA